jgi:hypothetical protein
MGFSAVCNNQQTRGTCQLVPANIYVLDESISGCPAPHAPHTCNNSSKTILPSDKPRHHSHCRNYNRHAQAVTNPINRRATRQVSRLNPDGQFPGHTGSRSRRERSRERRRKKKPRIAADATVPDPAGCLGEHKSVSITPKVMAPEHASGHGHAAASSTAPQIVPEPAVGHRHPATSSHSLGNNLANRNTLPKARTNASARNKDSKCGSSCARGILPRSHGAISSRTPKPAAPPKNIFAVKWHRRGVPSGAALTTEGLHGLVRGSAGAMSDLFCKSAPDLAAHPIDGVEGGQPLSQSAPELLAQPGTEGEGSQSASQPKIGTRSEHPGLHPSRERNVQTTPQQRTSDWENHVKSPVTVPNGVLPSQACRCASPCVQGPSVQLWCVPHPSSFSKAHETELGRRNATSLACDTASDRTVPLSARIAQQARCKAPTQPAQCHEAQRIASVSSPRDANNPAHIVLPTLAKTAQVDPSAASQKHQHMHGGSGCQDSTVCQPCALLDNWMTASDSHAEPNLLAAWAATSKAVSSDVGSGMAVQPVSGECGSNVGKRCGAGQARAARHRSARSSQPRPATRHRISIRLEPLDAGGTSTHLHSSSSEVEQPDKQSSTPIAATAKIAEPCAEMDGMPRVGQAASSSVGGDRRSNPTWPVDSCVGVDAGCNAVQHVDRGAGAHNAFRAGRREDAGTGADHGSDQERHVDARTGADGSSNAMQPGVSWYSAAAKPGEKGTWEEVVRLCQDAASAKVEAELQALGADPSLRSCLLQSVQRCCLMSAAAGATWKKEGQAAAAAMLQGQEGQSVDESTGKDDASGWAKAVSCHPSRVNSCRHDWESPAIAEECHRHEPTAMAGNGVAAESSEETLQRQRTDAGIEVSSLGQQLPCQPEIKLPPCHPASEEPPLQGTPCQLRPKQETLPPKSASSPIQAAVNGCGTLLPPGLLQCPKSPKSPQGVEGHAGRGVATTVNVTFMPAEAEMKAADARSAHTGATRERNAEVEAAEWARRKQEIQRQGSEVCPSSFPPQG